MTIGPDERDDLVARVQPEIVEDGDPLLGIDGTMNCVIAEAEPVGEIRIAGPGAGPQLAGQGVLSDLIRVACELPRIRPRGAIAQLVERRRLQLRRPPVRIRLAPLVSLLGLDLEGGLVPSLEVQRRAPQQAAESLRWQGKPASLMFKPGELAVPGVHPYPREPRDSEQSPWGACSGALRRSALWR